VLKRGKRVLKLDIFLAYDILTYRVADCKSYYIFVVAAAASYHVGSHMHKRIGNIY